MGKLFVLLPGGKWLYLQGSMEIEVIDVPDHLVVEWARRPRGDFTDDPIER